MPVNRNGLTISACLHALYDMCISIRSRAVQVSQSLNHSVVVVRLVVVVVVVVIDREFVTSAKKFANFNESFEIKKIRKNSYKNGLNARVGVAFQWNSLLI